MKVLFATLVIASVGLFAGAADTPLMPDGVNQILGRINPNTPEAEVEKIVKKHYPDAKRTLGSWSGQTGYVEFKLTSRYSISVAEYNDPKDFESRFVHADMILYVYDWELKRRINISFHRWDDEKKDVGKTSEQPPGRDK
ncbi:MAG: hypothetical protein ACYTG0_27870 [Planctomycetota bacterium]|jgi:hypothetical protein